MNVMKKAVLGLSAVGLMVLLLNMFGNHPTSLSYGRISVDDSQLTVTKSNQGLVEANNSGDVDAKREMDEKLWGKPGVALEPCWRKNLPKPSEKRRGFVLVTTSNGPHNHRAQIADAVVVAAQLGATLIVPSIKESTKEPTSRFEDIYNVKYFISSLEGVVRVVGKLPVDREKINSTITAIPLRVTREHIDEKVRPIFQQQGGLVFLGTFLSAVRGAKEDPEMAALRCLVMYEALQFVSAIQKLGDRLISRTREAAPESSGRRFVAVDVQLDLLRHKTCNVTDVKKKRCLEPEEVGPFLKRVGFPSETAIYITPSRWTPSLHSLQDMFPNVHTKEYSMPFNEENQYLFSGKTQYEQAVDFYVCSRSDVFIPSVPGVFYAHVAGHRISAGLNHIIVPTAAIVLGSDNSQFVGGSSPYVVKKTHPVYLCYTDPNLCAAANKTQILVQGGVRSELGSPPVKKVSRKERSKTVSQVKA